MLAPAQLLLPGSSPRAAPASVTCKPRLRAYLACHPAQGLTCLAQHPTQPLVFTGCLDGGVRCWDTRTGGCVRQWRGHVDVVQGLAVSPDGNMVLAGSEDECARVFSLLDD